MASDISRTDDSERPHYKGVVMQQGRVILDRDFNALQEITERRTDADALDFVGPYGTPDNGFAIETIIPDSPPLWVPPPPLSPPAPHDRDFLINPGTMFVGGERAVFPPADYGKAPITYSYFDQPDWINPDEPNADAKLEFVYLHLLEQEVSAVEDPDLKDVALGGPDTSQRLRLVQRVKRLKVDSGDCTAAFAQAQALWVNNNLAFDPKTMRLLPQASLEVSFSTQASQPDPCESVAQGGYLQPENQLIRVQIADGVAGGAPKLLWGYDNASFLYRADVSDSKTLLLRQSPADAFHIPRAGQVVEVLRSGLIINSEQDETDPLKPRSIVRCAAEATGVIRTLTAGYQPGDRSITLDQPLPADYVKDENLLFVRIWQSQLDLGASESSTVELIDTSNNSTTGIVVTINMSLVGGQLHAPVGAYWLLAVRPGTPQAVYPERFLTDAQPPDGPRQWVCPLAVIDWTGEDITSPPGSPPTNFLPIVRDCREKFDNLVELTKRKLGGCCAITIHPEDLQADPLALQNAIDKFANHAQGVAVCLTPGTYSLAQPLRLDVRHNGITIESCHGAAIVQVVPNTEVKFMDGLIVLAQSTSVTLRGISLKPSPVRLKDAVAISRDNAGSLGAVISGLAEPHMMIGLRLLDCKDVSVVDCEFQMVPLSGASNFAAAIFANGSCKGLTVRQSRFMGPALTFTTTIFNIMQPDQGAAEVRDAAGRRTAAGVEVSPEQAANIFVDTARQPFLHQLSINNPELLRALNLGFSAQANDRIQVPPAEILPPPVMLSAFMIAPSISSDSTGAPALVARAVLDQAEFIDNHMKDLTVAVVGISGAGQVRFRDNLITDCVGGIWFGGIDNASATRNNDEVEQTAEFQFLFKSLAGGRIVTEALNVALAYPLPNLKVNSPAALPTPQFHLTGNRINALRPLAAEGWSSGSAVVLILAPFSTRKFLDFDASLLLNSNELRNLGQPAALFAPTAFLYSRSAVVQGNLIQNLVKPAEQSGITSLYITAMEPAITGNVLKGLSNLAYTRPDISAKDFTAAVKQLDNWSFLNFDASTPFRT